MTQRRLASCTGLLAVLMTAAVIAGNAHFVGAPTISTNGDLLTVSGKGAGVGDVPQIHVVLEATASCINGGGNHPRAVNKASFNTAGGFSVINRARAFFSRAER